MKFLVTGGAGYIGSHFCQLATSKGHQVFVIDNLSTGHEKFAKYGEFLQADLRSPAQYADAIRGQTFDAVFHFAGKALVRESVEYPEIYYDNNPVATLRLLDILKDTPVRKFIFSSSCATYGIHSQPIKEDFQQSPINPYGWSKKQCEEILFDFHRRYGFEVGILRYFNVIGQDPSGDLWENHEPETHILPNIMNAEVNGEVLNILGTQHPTDDGTCVRDYTDVRDLAKVHLKALEQVSQAKPFLSNLGNGTGLSIRELIKVYEKTFQTKVQVKELEAHTGDPPTLIASDEFFRGWYSDPFFSLEESLLSLEVRRKSLHKSLIER